MRFAEVDTVLEENSGPLKDTIADFKTFSDGLRAQHPASSTASSPGSREDDRRRHAGAEDYL